MPTGTVAHPFPVLRWVSVAWLAVFVVVFWHAHGPRNFLWFCDIAVLLGCVGVFVGSPLLISSQAVSSLVVQTVWTVELIIHYLFGRGLLGGLGWMFDPNASVFVRLLSLYHGVWPFFLVWCVWKVGYDRRAIAFQSVVALLAVSAGRLAGREHNINGAYVEPVFGLAWGPGPLHVIIVTSVLIGIVYLPTHWALRRLFSDAVRHG